MAVSLELGFCFTVVVVSLGYLIVSGYTYSLQFDVGGTFDGHLPGLQQGWLFGRKIDLSDKQWRDFRSSIPALCTVFFIFGLLSRFLPILNNTKDTTVSQEKKRAFYYIIFSFIFLAYLHGIYLAHIVFFVSLNWLLAKQLAGHPRIGFLAAWMFNVLLLIAVRIWNGFPPSHILGQSFSWLDSYQGAMRWYISFNLTVLRMLSFWIDLHWMRMNKNDNSSSSSAATIESSSAVISQPTTSRERQQTPLVIINNNDIVIQSSLEPLVHSKAKTSPPPSIHTNNNNTTPFDFINNNATNEHYYSWIFAMAHALYAPLYIAGPIITYQDFIWQLRLRSASDAKKNTTNIIRYAVRLASDLVCIELVTHFMYFNSIAVHKIGKRYKIYGLKYNAAEVGITAWWVLSFMWLKFATIWRTFRLAALFEGIDPPENMIRCFANNYDIEGFWRGWHASYNKWLVRYMYIPLGGSSRRMLVIWPIFFFVAVWHDLEWRLMSWAWLICFAFVPEMIAKNAARSKYFDHVRKTSSFRSLCACAAAINIAALMAVNMVGFVVGTDGVSDLFRELFASPGYVVTTFFVFYCGAQVIFAWREYDEISTSVQR